MNKRVNCEDFDFIEHQDRLSAPRPVGRRAMCEQCGNTATVKEHWQATANILWSWQFGIVCQRCKYTYHRCVYDVRLLPEESE